MVIVSFISFLFYLTVARPPRYPATSGDVEAVLEAIMIGGIPQPLTT